MPLPLTALLVGEIGAGKTTVCLRVAGQARRRGWRVGGIVSRPPVDAEGRRTGLAAEDLWTGEGRLLARLEPDPGALRCGRYSFDPDAFTWGCRAVQQALAQGADLIILDEVGPLELASGAGFAPVLGMLLGARCPRLLVVRRAWRRALEEQLPGPPLVFELNSATREALAARIVAALRAPEAEPAAGSLRWSLTG
ncbi:MAG: nucleoside-triphosphatase [Anaerolineae bacterium]|nr:nucleoside-triphosphatase [Anaerolineae bacterium]